MHNTAGSFSALNVQQLLCTYYRESFFRWCIFLSRLTQYFNQKTQGHLHFCHPNLLGWKYNLMCISLRSINPYHGPASTLHWFYPPQSLRCRTCPVLSPHLNHIQPLVSHQKILTRNLSAFPPNQQKPLSKVRQLSHAHCCLSSWFLSIYFSFITFTFTFDVHFQHQPFVQIFQFSHLL